MQSDSEIIKASKQPNYFARAQACDQLIIANIKENKSAREICIEHGIS